MKRKKVIRLLKKMAESLPEQTYKAYHKYSEPRAELDEKGEKVFRLGYLADHKINHGRRLRKQFDLAGFFPGVETYLQKLGFSLFTQHTAG